MKGRGVISETKRRLRILEDKLAGKQQRDRVGRLEKRVATLEQTVAELQEQLASLSGTLLRTKEPPK